MNDATRRTVLLAGAGLMAGAAAPGETLAWGFSFPSIEEGTLDFSAFKGRVLLVVNTASFCGYTSQYEGLEAMHRALEPRGLTVVGIPSQDFNQESSTNAAVKQFCDATFGVEFPMSGLLHVRGPEAHPFYRWVRAAQGWEPEWNFYKVLIGRDGRVQGLFTSDDAPSRGRLPLAVETALSASA